MTLNAEPGAVVAGRYRIEGVIGEGGMGVVYRALDVNVGRPVALKLLHPTLSGQADVQARFEREAMLARTLNHPNTVRLHDFGRDGGDGASRGALYIVYELLEGQPLDVAIRSGPLSPDRVARIGKQVLKSLMEAHGRGVVHRDIKPSNIFLCDFSGERDFVKVLDFGIAKAGGAAALTSVGMAVGTPSYMAPEQVRGAEVTAATDVYALGLVLAEALSGAMVVPNGSIEEIASAQLSPAPLSLPAAALQSPLGPVIHRAVQKAVERRFATAEEMLDELEAVAVVSSAPTQPKDRVSFGMAPTGAAVPLLGVAPPAKVEARKSVSGAPLGWIALGVVALVLIGGAFAFALASGKETGERAESAPSERPRRKPSAPASGSVRPAATSASAAPSASAASPNAAPPPSGAQVPTPSTEQPPPATLVRCEALPPNKYAFEATEADLRGAIGQFLGTRCLGVRDALDLARACFATTHKGDIHVDATVSGYAACNIDVRTLELGSQRFIHLANTIAEGSQIHQESYIFFQDRSFSTGWATYYWGFTGGSPLCTAGGPDTSAGTTSPRMRADWPTIPEDARVYFCRDGSGVPAAPK